MPGASLDCFAQPAAVFRVDLIGGSVFTIDYEYVIVEGYAEISLRRRRERKQRLRLSE